MAGCEMNTLPAILWASEACWELARGYPSAILCPRPRFPRRRSQGSERLSNYLRSESLLVRREPCVTGSLEDVVEGRAKTAETWGQTRRRGGPVQGHACELQHQARSAPPPGAAGVPSSHSSWQLLSTTAGFARIQLGWHMGQHHLSLTLHLRCPP